MTSTFLVPLDGSLLAETILPHVSRLVKDSAARVILLGVATLPAELQTAAQVHPGLRFGGPGAELDRVVADEKQRLRQYLDEQAAHLACAGLHVRVEVRQARLTDAALEIVRCVEELQADVVAMSTHGRTGLAQLLHGSVAGTVLRTAGCPVLLYRPPSDAFERQRHAMPKPAETRTEAPAAGSPRRQVRDIMVQPVVSVREDATLEEIARLMLEHAIGAVPVVDAAGKLRGIVTESDYTGKEQFFPFSAYRAPQLFRQWVPKDGIEAIYTAGRRITARQIMTSPVITAAEDESVTELVERMLRRNLKRIPVVRDRVPIGMVTRHDLLKLMIQDAAQR